ncbi:exodeoxyribonuclease V subunit gamma [Janibacter melonis]|uniref:exodeoxyribonuclease V subunit gamma n=1 Tax=Janibacter melonis TaxID=262209 RepID=UPI00204459B5|nr:exodeoxyribonuclease V subunit gamma [Janibacter melonis]MCM3553594.1 exodeoxyribonuclease V subunit gamma [Janibacter melonis]
MTLHLHRAVRTAELADDLGALLADPLPDPFAEEVVVVPEHGVERWLAQRLSHRLGAGEAGSDGVCAGVRFVRPASLVTLLTGRELDDPWLPAHLVWPLLASIDAALDEPWAAALARHLGHGQDEDDVRRGRRYGLALRLARLLHRYGVQRPAVLTAWREGRDEDLETLTSWVGATGVRWGFDAAGRSPFALSAERQNTWDFGLDRLLAGVAVSADGPLSIGGHTLPYDDVGSGSIELAGILAEVVDRLRAATEALGAARSASQWTDALREAVLDLTDVPTTDAWQIGELERVLAEASRHSPEDLPLRIADVRVLLADGPPPGVRAVATRAGRSAPPA